jgi:hypothetical protein
MAPSPNHSQHEPAKSMRISMELHSRKRHVIWSDNHVPITLCCSTQTANPDIVRPPTVSSSACYWTYVHDNAHKKWGKHQMELIVLLNPLQPSGHYMYHRFNTKNSTFCPHSVFLCCILYGEELSQRFKTSGMWCCAAAQTPAVPNISQDLSVFIFRAKHSIWSVWHEHESITIL